MTTLLPGLGPLFFGILRGSAWFWACCRASRWTQLEGNRPLVRPGPATGRPGPAKAPSSQPALFAQPNCKQNAEKPQSQEARLYNDNGISNRKQDAAHKSLHATKAAVVKQNTFYSNSAFFVDTWIITRSQQRYENNRNSFTFTHSCCCDVL